MTEAIRIVGAGPAGLTAAIVLAKGGRQVEVFERRPSVGFRFHDDYQGLENWSVQEDTLVEFERAGLEIDFPYEPFTGGRIYSPSLKHRDIVLKRTLFYLVKRGPGLETLDAALERQALRAGVQINYGQAAALTEADIVATGPRGVRAVAAGITFDTGHADQACIAVGEDIAPQGYTYLLIANGRGTLATVLFSEFKSAPERLARSIDVFQKLLPLDMLNVREWGGYGAFRIPTTAISGGQLLVGEAAGFQDYLFGFGIRCAMLSGYLAARSILCDEDYDRLWRQRLLPTLRSSEFNRRLYSRLGSLAYYGLWFVLGYAPHPDKVMRWLYNWRGGN